MNELVIEVFKSIATQGPLVGFLFYLYVKNEEKIKEKDARIKEMTDTIVETGRETLTTISNNTAANVQLRETINDLKRR